MAQAPGTDARAEAAKLAQVLQDKATAVAVGPEQLLALLSDQLRGSHHAARGGGHAASGPAPLASEQRYRALFERSPDAIFAVDPQGRFVEANPACEAITGYTRAELLNVTFTQLCAPDQLDKTAAHFQRRVGGGAGLETTLIRKDGRRVQLLVTGGPVVVDGQVVEVHCTATDITERKRAEAALRESEARYRLLFESMGEGFELCELIWDADERPADYRVLEANPAYETVTGLRRDQAIGRRATEILPVIAPAWLARFGHVVRTATPLRFEEYSGSLDRWLEVYAYPVGQANRFALVFSDITDRKRAEEELKAANRGAERAKEEAEAASRAKDQFLAVLSHELRTPLTPVATAAHLLEAQYSLSMDQRDLVSMIRRNVDLEARLIDDLLDLTRISRGKLDLHLDCVDAHERIRHVVEMVGSDAAAKRLTLSVEVKADQCHVRADAARLQQVLWNVLKNAVKFTPVGGRITVRTDNPQPGKLAVSVQDTGIGIEAEVLPRIFDAFEQGGKDVTRQFGGLGLGLAISKGLTELQGGTLTASSQGRDKGATFTLTLPTTVAPRGKSGRARTAMGVAAEATGHRLLLVEDNADTATLMARLLRGYGYEVVVADSVAAALRAADGHRFALLVSDIGLPDGSGLDLMRQLQARYAIRGIALSGFGMDEDIRKSRAAGFAAHLTKPVNVQKLQEAIRRALA